jgi:hypothetical protein
MKSKYLICAGIILVFSGFYSSYGQKIYLSPEGNDGNPGTIDKPLATLTAARDRAREYRRNGNKTDTVRIVPLAGEYFMFQPLSLSAEDSGTPDLPLIIKPEDGAKVIFRGGVKLAGIEKVNSKLWRIFVPQVAWYDSYFDQLYVNGRRAVRARTPDKGFFTVKQAAQTVLIRGSGPLPQLAVQQIQLDSAGADCVSHFTGNDYKDAVVTFYHKWDNTMKHIAGFDDSTSSIRTIGKGMQPWNTIDGESRYYIDNIKSGLDAPGEWYLDRTGYLYYIPKEGESIENVSFFAPVLKEFIVLQGDSSAGRRVANIRFMNLSFEIADFRLPPDGNEAMQAASPIGATITLDFADNIFFQNCEVAHTGTYAFWFRRACSNCTVSHSYLHDLGAGGIKIGETVIRPDTNEITRNIVVDNNIITGGGKVFPSAVGIIIFNASDNRLTHNEISDLGYSGISAGWVWGYTPSPSKRNMIEFNHIHHLGWGELSDMGGVYTLGASEGTSVSNNVIHHIYSYDYGGWGLYTDEGSFGITEENNLVYMCKSSGFHQHYGKENIIRNNIFALNIRAQLQATRIENHRSLSFTNNIVYFNSGTLFSSNWSRFNLFTDYNCYWDARSKAIDFGKTFKEWQKSGKDVHSIIADPQFVNPEAFDFHFKSSRVAKKIKFTPFDYSRAGVYGSERWKELAEFDPDLSKKFDNMVLEREYPK